MGKKLTTSGSIKTGVAKNHLIARIGDAITRHKSDPTTVHPFPDVVVGLTHQAHGHALNKECSKALAGRSVEVQIQLAFKATIPRSFCNLSGYSCTNTGFGFNDLDHAAESAMVMDCSH
jgi:hypothetical protein